MYLPTTTGREGSGPLESGNNEPPAPSQSRKPLMEGKYVFLVIVFPFCHFHDENLPRRIGWDGTTCIVCNFLEIIAILLGGYIAGGCISVLPSACPESEYDRFCVFFLVRSRNALELVFILPLLIFLLPELESTLCCRQICANPPHPAPRTRLG